MTEVSIFGIFDIFFYGIPIFLIGLLIFNIFCYVDAKAKNKKSPGTIPSEEIKKRKIMLIVFSVLAVVSVAVVIGLIVLFYQAVAHM